MAVMQFSARAAAGLIHLEIPVNADGNYDVEVTVRPKPEVNGDTRKPTPEELGWPPGYFENVFDSITDPAFERGDQGEYEVREPFE